MLTQSEIDAIKQEAEEKYPMDDPADYLQEREQKRYIEIVTAERQRAKVLLETLDEIQRRAHTGYIAELARKTLNTYNKYKPNDRE